MVCHMHGSKPNTHSSSSSVISFGYQLLHSVSTYCLSTIETHILKPLQPFHTLLKRDQHAKEAKLGASCKIYLSNLHESIETKIHHITQFFSHTMDDTSTQYISPPHERRPLTRPLRLASEYALNICEFSSLCFNSVIFILKEAVAHRRHAYFAQTLIELLISMPLHIIFRSVVQPMIWLITRIFLQTYVTLRLSTIIPIQLYQNMRGLLIPSRFRIENPLDQHIESDFFGTEPTLQNILHLSIEMINTVLICISPLFITCPIFLSASYLTLLIQQYMIYTISYSSLYPVIPEANPNLPIGTSNYIGGITPLGSIDVLSTILLTQCSTHNLLRPMVLIASNKSIRQALYTFIRTTEEHITLALLQMQGLYRIYTTATAHQPRPSTSFTSETPGALPQINTREEVLTKASKPPMTAHAK